MITYSKNVHRYSVVNQDLQVAPAPLENQTKLNLNVVISEQDFNRKEAAKKVTFLENELYHKKKMTIEELESLHKSSKKEAVSLSEELLNANKEHEKSVKPCQKYIQDHRTGIQTLTS